MKFRVASVFLSNHYTWLLSKQPNTPRFEESVKMFKSSKSNRRCWGKDQHGPFLEDKLTDQTPSEANRRSLSQEIPPFMEVED
jgi:hypothetical protein